MFILFKVFFFLFETFGLLSNFSYLTLETKLSDEIMRWFDSFFVFIVKRMQCKGTMHA